MRQRAFILGFVVFISITIGHVSSQSTSSALFIVEDGVGDARIHIGEEQIPNPLSTPTPYTDMIDIVSLKVTDEDEIDLTLELRFVDLTPLLYPADAGIDYAHSIQFQVAGYPATYLVGFQVFGGQYANLAGSTSGEPVPIYNLEFCVLHHGETGADVLCENLQRARGWIDFPGDRFLFEIPKLSILGQNPPLRTNAGALPHHLPSGSELTAWQAISAKKPLSTPTAPSEPNPTIQDQVPDDGPSVLAYAIKRPAANVFLKIEGPGVDPTGSLEGHLGAHDASGMTDPLTVAPGKSSRLTLTIFNDQESKRLVNLSVEFADEDDTRWIGQIAPTIEVRAHSERSVNLFVRPGPDFVHGGESVAHVRAVSVGHPDEAGAVRVPLKASVPPSVESPVLYTHVASVGVRGTLDENRWCNGPAEGLYPACNNAYTYWMNTSPTDPEADRDDQVPLSQFVLTQPGTTRLMQVAFGMDAGLVFPLTLDANRLATLQLAFSARTSIDVEITAHLGLTKTDDCNRSCPDFVGMGSATKTGTIGPSRETIDLEIPLNPDFGRVAPEDGRFVLILRVDTADETATLSLAENAHFHPSESAVELPIVAGDLSDSPSFIGLYPEGDVEEFVNPDKTKLFEAVLANEGVEKKLIAVETHIDGSGWKAELLPADKYALEPGQTARLAALVTAPQDAAEGTSATITLDAYNLERPEDRRQLTLRATVTQGVEIADERDGYEPDADTLEKVYAADEGADSPNLPGAALIFVLAGLAAYSRMPIPTVGRRRQI